MKRDPLTLLFSEGVIGFLGLVAMAVALGPMVFDVAARWHRPLYFVEWMLIAVFAADLARRGLRARDRARWIRSPWRLVDVVVVTGPLLALLPQVADVAGASPSLRLLRLFRAVAFGTRARANALRTQRRPDPASRGVPPTLTVLNADGRPAPVRSDWDSFLDWTRAPESSWFHAANLDSDRFRELASSRP